MTVGFVFAQCLSSPQALLKGCPLGLWHRTLTVGLKSSLSHTGRLMNCSVYKKQHCNLVTIFTIREAGLHVALKEQLNSESALCILLLISLLMCWNLQTC